MQDTDWEKTFSNNISNKVIISRVYKNFYRSISKKEQNN